MDEQVIEELLEVFHVAARDSLALCRAVKPTPDYRTWVFAALTAAMLYAALAAASDEFAVSVSERARDLADLVLDSIFIPQ